MMTQELPPYHDRALIVRASIASAGLIGAAYVIAFSQVRLGGPIAPWHAFAMMSAHLAVAGIALENRRPALALGVARAVSIATRIGIVVVTFVVLPGQLLILFAPEAAGAMGLFGLFAAAQSTLLLLGVGGTLLVFAMLFVLQVVLGRAAREQASNDTGNVAFASLAAGAATLLLPLAIAGDVNERATAAESRSSSLVGSHAMADANMMRVANGRRADERVLGVLVRLHPCVGTRCLDSLMRAARSQGVSVIVQPQDTSRYLAVVADDSGGGARFVTDESGVRLRWSGGSADVRFPDSATVLTPMDRASERLLTMADCYAKFLDQRGGLAPERIELAACGLVSDAMRMQLDGGEYLVRYIHRASSTPGGAAGFALAARPVQYGVSGVRSYLVIPGDGVYGTAADRDATEKDQRAMQCELERVTCRLGGR